jgi:hypothetical protein
LTLIQKILSFFSSDKTNNPRQISEESKKAFDTKYDDEGKFVYYEDGIVMDFISGQQKILWTDVEQLIAYKRDLLTIDVICLDIIFDNKRMTINEDTPGWYQFIKKTKLIFPSIPVDWDMKIMHPAFQTNLTIIYQRAD